MGVNHFSKEQIDELSKNPYVQRVTEKAITYTEQFREEFYLKYNHGDTPASILRSMGFNTKVLGQKRINGIVQRIKKMAEKGTFEDSREGSSGRPRTKEMTAEEEIAYLKHKIEYQKQQIEALKKFNLWRRKRYGNSRRKIQNNLRNDITRQQSS